MIETRFTELLDRWSTLLPGGAGGALDTERLRRAMRSAFELGVAARSHNLVADRKDEHGELLSFDGSTSQSNTIRWPCPTAGRYGLLFKAWRPNSNAPNSPTDAIVEFGWEKVDTVIQKKHSDWHGAGVAVSFDVGNGGESTVLTVISQNSPVKVEIQAYRAADSTPIGAVLNLSLNKNQATRRVLFYAVD